jgi:hypothetical protein
MTTVAAHAAGQHVLIGVGDREHPSPSQLHDQPGTKNDRDTQERLDSAC